MFYCTKLTAYSNLMSNLVIKDVGLRLIPSSYSGCKLIRPVDRYQKISTSTSSARLRMGRVTLIHTCGHQFHSSSFHHFGENHVFKSLALIDNVKQVRDSPVAALMLGFAGLVPFVAAPAYIISTGIFLPSIAYTQLAYGASILSFIGGVRWGLTLPQGSTQSPDWHNLGYSVTPSLIAWAALLASPTLGFLAVMGGLGLTGYMDIAMWGYPNWFKGMRFCLTLVAVLSLWTTLMCRFIMSSERVDSSNNTDTQKNKT